MSSQYDEIYEILSNSCVRGPQMDSFNEYIAKKNYKKARHFLSSELKLSENETDKVLSYYQKRNETKYNLVELSKDNYSLLKNDEKVVISYGGEIRSALVVKSIGSPMCIYSSCEEIKIEKINQIWKKVPQDDF